MRIKSFRGYRPEKGKAARVASRPYDVLTTAEAREEARGNPCSFLNVVKSEITLPADIDPCSPKVYQAAADNFQALTDNGTFIRDARECLYVYELAGELTGAARPKTGIVAVAAVEDYLTGKIKKHELTRPDKETDRINHIRATMLNAEPVMFAYKYDRKIEAIVEGVKKARPEYEFTADDGVQHRFWVISDTGIINAIVAAFAKISATYVADGHHRTAAAAAFANSGELSQETPAFPHNYFLAVHFPDNQLEILDYNRLVTDLNGHDTDSFLDALTESFFVRKTGKQPVKPGQHHETGMYLEGNWYRLTAKPGRYDDSDAIAALGFSVLSEHILKPMLDIHDLRTDKRIDFVGGARGLKELEKRVNSGEMAVAFAMCPISMQQLMTIADEGRIMPPKVTWFEPKLRSGLIVYSLKD